MPQTALFMGPMARKKIVHGQYEPNTYRMISQQAEPSYLPRALDKSGFTMREEFNILGQAKDMRPSVEFRHNRPNPRRVNFLRQDVKLLNEPVCDVHTDSTHLEQNKWWTHPIPSDQASTAHHTLDTTVRDDFQYRGSGHQRNSRHGSNPNSNPALGAVPVNMLKKADGSQRWLKEGISYEHQYNSRLDPSYPVRSKRHGTFVWSELPANQVTKLMTDYGVTKPQSASSQAEPSVIQPVPVQAEPVPVEPGLKSVPVLPPISAL